LAPLSPHKPIDMTHGFPTTRISILRQKAAKGTSSHLEWEGRSQGFTNAFMGAMYTDQSLHTTSLKVERNRQRLEQLKEKEQQIHVKRDEFIKKQAIADLITEEFPRVKLPI
jgi:FixJ family two-component response regulator